MPGIDIQGIVRSQLKDTVWPLLEQLVETVTFPARDVEDVYDVETGTVTKGEGSILSARAIFTENDRARSALNSEQAFRSDFVLMFQEQDLQKLGYTFQVDDVVTRANGTTWRVQNVLIDPSTSLATLEIAQTSS